MTDRQTGLRFDIYERVQLADGVVSISELEEVELLPHIQVYPQEDQAVLRGNLLLAGTYLAEGEGESRTLEHLIPVEITLPLNRIQSVDEISVEIENFDIDVLSPRRLNVTGVLSLNGVEMISASGGQWQEEEEIVFVHENQPEARPQSVQPYSFQGLTEAQSSGNEPERAPGPAHFYGDVSLSETHANAASEPIFNRGAFFQEEPGDIPERAFRQPKEVPLEPESVLEQSASQPEAAQQEPAPLLNEPPLFGNTQVEEAKAAAEPAEMKIGFSGRDSTVQAQEKAKSADSVSLLHKLSGSSGPSRARQEKAEPAAAAAVAENKLDVLEWKKLFLSSDSGEQGFKKLRMCIVQKDETLDGISKRYQINPREIALYNRLEGSDVIAGQIIYLPR